MKRMLCIHFICPRFKMIKSFLRLFLQGYNDKKIMV
jgi:hypothetical protein